jgi:hypothetical protein
MNSLARTTSGMDLLAHSTLDGVMILMQLLITKSMRRQHVATGLHLYQSMRIVPALMKKLSWEELDLIRTTMDKISNLAIRSANKIENAKASLSQMQDFVVLTIMEFADTLSWLTLMYTSSLPSMKHHSLLMEYVLISNTSTLMALMLLIARNRLLLLLVMTMVITTMLNMLEATVEEPLGAEST